jgi:hypothetical protein
VISRTLASAEEGSSLNPPRLPRIEETDGAACFINFMLFISGG